MRGLRLIRFRPNCAVMRSRYSYVSGKDRKSTRLNSSHQIISYAVFCLKKKNTTANHSPRVVSYRDVDAHKESDLALAQPTPLLAAASTPSRVQQHPTVLCSTTHISPLT